MTAFNLGDSLIEVNACFMSLISVLVGYGDYKKIASLRQLTKFEKTQFVPLNLVSNFSDNINSFCGKK